MGGDWDVLKASTVVLHAFRADIKVPAFVSAANGRRSRFPRDGCQTRPATEASRGKVEQKARRRIASGEEQKTTSTDDTKSLRVRCKPVRAPHCRTNKA